MKLPITYSSEFAEVDI